MSVAPLQFLLPVFAGWVNRRALESLEYVQEENRVLRERPRFGTTIAVVGNYFYLIAGFDGFMMKTVERATIAASGP
jgi:hypothetical protein